AGQVLHVQQPQPPRRRARPALGVHEPLVEHPHDVVVVELGKGLRLGPVVGGDLHRDQPLHGPLPGQEHSRERTAAETVEQGEIAYPAADVDVVERVAVRRRRTGGGGGRLGLRGRRGLLRLRAGTGHGAGTRRGGGGAGGLVVGREGGRLSDPGGRDSGIRRENARAVVGFAVRVGGRGDGRDRAVVGFAVRVGGRGDGRDRGVGFAVARAGIARARVGVRPPGRARPARRRLRGAEGGGGVEGGRAAAREVGGVVG